MSDALTKYPLPTSSLDVSSFKIQNSSLAGGFFAFFLLLLEILLVVLWITSLVNVLQRNFKNPTDKIIWLLVIIFIPILGSIIYIVTFRKTLIKITTTKRSK